MSSVRHVSARRGENVPVEWLLVSTQGAKRDHLVKTSVKLAGSLKLELYYVPKVVMSLHFAKTSSIV
jgi:hypothetical protein